jgi:hypothetical protein
MFVRQIDVQEIRRLGLWLLCRRFWQCINPFTSFQSIFDNFMSLCMNFKWIFHGFTGTLLSICFISLSHRQISVKLSPVSGCCEHYHTISSSINRSEFLRQLRNAAFYQPIHTAISPKEHNQKSTWRQNLRHWVFAGYVAVIRPVSTG